MEGGGRLGRRWICAQNIKYTPIGFDNCYSNVCIWEEGGGANALGAPANAQVAHNLQILDFFYRRVQLSSAPSKYCARGPPRAFLYISLLLSLSLFSRFTFGRLISLVFLALSHTRFLSRTSTPHSQKKARRYWDSIII
jgi:hypothetical protein